MRDELCVRAAVILHHARSELHATSQRDVRGLPRVRRRHPRYFQSNQTYPSTHYPCYWYPAHTARTHRAFYCRVFRCPQLAFMTEQGYTKRLQTAAHDARLCPSEQPAAHATGALSHHGCATVDATTRVMPWWLTSLTQPRAAHVRLWLCLELMFECGLAPCNAQGNALVRDSDYMHTLAPQCIREPAPRDHMQLESCSGWPRQGAGFYTERPTLFVF